ncbi:thiosulfate sulfurtransferase 18 [Fagus crenata]
MVDIHVVAANELIMDCSITISGSAENRNFTEHGMKIAFHATPCRWFASSVPTPNCQFFYDPPMFDLSDSFQSYLTEIQLPNSSNQSASFFSWPRGMIPRFATSAGFSSGKSGEQPPDLKSQKSKAKFSGAEVVTVDVHAAKDQIKSGHKYLDVRTVEEYKKGHVGADKILNIPYMFNTPEGRVKNPQFLNEVSSACNKEDHLIVGCQSGVRSLYATADLLSAGFKHASNMGGGYLAWVENGFLVQEPDDEL